MIDSYDPVQTALRIRRTQLDLGLHFVMYKSRCSKSRKMQSINRTYTVVM